ncbi:hypothetical protein BFP70_06160 [Thioclava sp. SK-1]|uniref:GntR family transcriptional regulator n=1 Tax=Thioclava sp. SK-1 TaxID=1889770 RepID=UPI000826CDC4|nr:GntR family transcriptional regulator [Thioclava sp. SK-1]OCX66283.1 hypothetical protein BFP70_06160 [Thioclava sp. SK-1]
MQPRLWKSISSALHTDIAGGRDHPGDKRPTEAKLAARFGVGSHTLRRGTGDRVTQTFSPE